MIEINNPNLIGKIVKINKSFTLFKKKYNKGKIGKINNIFHKHYYKIYFSDIAGEGIFKPAEINIYQGPLQKLRCKKIYNAADRIENKPKKF